MPSSSKQTDFLLRHEILNRMTKMRFLMDAKEPLNEQVKRDFLDALAWVSFLVAQPELFHGKASQVFLAETNLQDLLEITFLLQAQAAQKHIQGKFSENEVRILTDKNRSKEILAHLLRFILEKAGSVKWLIKGSKLLFKHDQGLLVLPRLTPLECLNAVGLNDFERLFCCLLHQAEAANLNIVSRKKGIEVKFKLLNS